MPSDPLNTCHSATLLLAMSCNGCIQRPSFVRQLFQAERRGFGAIPIIVYDRFQYPSDVFFFKNSVLFQPTYFQGQ